MVTIEDLKRHASSGRRNIRTQKTDRTSFSRAAICQEGWSDHSLVRQNGTSQYVIQIA